MTQSKTKRLNLCYSRILLLTIFLFFCIIIVAFLPTTHHFFSHQSADFLVQSDPTFNTNLFPEIQQLSFDQYPVYTPLLSVLTRWNPNNPTLPNGFSESLQHFNFSDHTERALAEAYRKAELPFKVYDVPIFNKVAKKWTKPYLSRNFRNMK
jgi:hypothetical protein